MKSLIFLSLVLISSSIFGFWHWNSQGLFKSKERKLEVSSKEIGGELGSRLTLLQFSSAFCSPCRTTKVLLSNLTRDLPDVKHLDINAESNLGLARRLNILSTPTTIVLDADGREISRAVGIPRKDQVLNLLEMFEI